MIMMLTTKTLYFPPAAAFAVLLPPVPSLSPVQNHFIFHPMSVVGFSQSFGHGNDGS